MKKQELVDTCPGLQGFFGLAEADITPTLDIYARNWGAAKQDRYQEIHRPLCMQCLAISTTKDAKALFLLTADLGWWKNAADEQQIRQAILSACQLTEDQLLLCLSHTHAGPVVCSTDYDKPGGEHIVPYLQLLVEKAITLIRQCTENKVSAKLTWTYGTCDLAANRDLDLEGEMLVGFNPVDAADQTLLVGLLEKDNGEKLAVLVNYACHPTTLAHENIALSPDYVGAMRELVRAHTGATCLFLQGASGELAPREQYVADPAIADAHGRKLGYAVLSTLTGMLPAGEALLYTGKIPSGADLAVWTRAEYEMPDTIQAMLLTVDLPLKPLGAVEEIEQAWTNCQDRVLKDRLWRKLNTLRSLGNGNTAKAKLWIWKLGAVLLVAQPNETYACYQQQLRAAFPNTILAVVNIANGYIGYLPPASLYAKTMYAVEQTPYAKGALEILIESTISALQTIKP